MPQLSVGDDAPQFTLPAIDGTTFDMSAMKGKRGHSYLFQILILPIL